MKKVFLVLVLFSGFSAHAIDASCISGEMSHVTQTPANSTQTRTVVSNIQPEQSNFQRGCCSHHGGVCGCSYGRTQCCDGTQSPSCTCSKSSSDGSGC